MDSNAWIVLSIAMTIIVALIAVVYKNLVSRMEESSKQSRDGLRLKVDLTEYKIVREWEQDVFSNMKMSIRELKDENRAEHTAIMLELKKRNGWEKR